MSGRCRILVLLSLVLPGIVACDASPTAIDSLDSTRLEQLVLATNGSVTPAERVLLDVLARIEDPDGTPIELPHLDSLFQLALTAEAGRSPARAARLRNEHDEIIARAWQAIDAGETRTGERILAEARSSQARSVTEILGVNASAAFVSLLGRALDLADEELLASDPAGLGPRGPGRMAESARDLEADARMALARGDAARALDIATHAAGLVNSLLRRMPPR